MASSCADWAKSITQRWRSFFLEENDFPPYETWADIDLSTCTQYALPDFYHPYLVATIPDKFKRRQPAVSSKDVVEDALKEVKEEVSEYKIQTQELLDEMKSLIKESLEEKGCSLLWRMYQEAEEGQMKDRMAATFLEKCKDSLGRKT